MKREIWIRQEYEIIGSSENESEFYDIFKVKIHYATLKELLMFKSIYVCRNQIDIINVILDQPDPTIFFKSFLQFDLGNLMQLFSFEGDAYKYLLNDKFQRFFTPEYPLFYKNKFKRVGSSQSFFRNAIDKGIEMNQFESVELALKYITKYQNNFYSSFLFAKNLHLIM